MSKEIRTKENILSKLGITELNPMQTEAYDKISQHPDVILHSPTGTGKTLAFLLPVIEKINTEVEGVQVIIITPTRELAIQIETVIKNMGTGLRAFAVYGGRSVSRDIEQFKTAPSILVGTPGRVSDHLYRVSFNSETVHTLILDEYDKSLEIGFEEEMKDILYDLKHLKNKILTSATKSQELPHFINLKKPSIIDFSSKTKAKRLELRKVTSENKDKLEALKTTLEALKGQSGIIFCNFKETIAYISEFLDSQGITHGQFYGGLEQRDRERALIKFRNGTYHVLLATDLASRGIDVPELNYIIHYQLPHKEEEFIHRNGRTARMNSSGVAYVLLWEKDRTVDYVGNLPEAKLQHKNKATEVTFTTLFISGGRKDKISKGDIVGLFMKKGNLTKEDIGDIELKQDCAFVAVNKAKVTNLIEITNNKYLKKKKVRISEV